MNSININTLFAQTHKPNLLKAIVRGKPNEVKTALVDGSNSSEIDLLTYALDLLDNQTDQGSGRYEVVSILAEHFDDLYSNPTEDIKSILEHTETLNRKEEALTALANGFQNSGNAKLFYLTKNAIESTTLPIPQG